MDIEAINLDPAKDICNNCFLYRDSVVFKSEGSVIKCQRALYNLQSNSIEATGNLRVYRKGNKYPLRGDKLFFDVNTNVAHLRDNVRYSDEKVSFTTDNLDYNTATEEGHYFDGGVIKDSVNTLVSKQGYLFKNNDMVVKDSVTISTPDYLVVSDSIKYNSDSQTVFIIAPTTLYSDSSTLYAERGYYQTVESYAYLTKNARMNRGSYKLKGDTISYNETTLVGEGWSNLEMNDTLQKIIFRGNYVYYNDSISYSFMTDSARILFYSGFDTLYAHADTFFNYVDTADVQYFSGYPNVRFFRLDIQGKCDSLVYNMEEGVATMYYDPIMWALYNQMSGNIVKIYNTDGHVSHIELEDDAFIISREDSIRFNQVKGRLITGYLANNDLKKIVVDGQAQSIYYSRDGIDLVGYNQSESNYLIIYLKEGQVNKLISKPTTNGNFFSIDSNPYEEQFLKDFQWRSDLRPISPWDIYRRTPRETTNNDKKRRRVRPER